MSDLLYAPPSFHNAKRQRVIFVDFLRAEYSIEFDCKAKQATAASKIVFQAKSDGYPLILLNQPHGTVVLDEHIVGLESENSIDKEGYAKILSKPVQAGRHTLTIETRSKENKAVKVIVESPQSG